jgi:hypothetical protein
MVGDGVSRCQAFTVVIAVPLDPVDHRHCWPEGGTDFDGRVNTSSDVQLDPNTSRQHLGCRRGRE